MHGLGGSTWPPPGKATSPFKPPMQSMHAACQPVVGKALGYLGFHTLQATIAVRDRVVQAYQEIIRMPI